MVTDAYAGSYLSLVAVIETGPTARPVPEQTPEAFVSVEQFVTATPESRPDVVASLTVTVRVLVDASVEGKTTRANPPVEEVGVTLT